MHNKKYALELVQNKLNGLNNLSYSKIGSMTGYTKLQIINFSKLLKEKDIDSILVHGLTHKPSNNSASDKEIEFIKNFKNQYPIISISQFMDIYHEDVIFNENMKDIVKNNSLKQRSYSFFESLYEKFDWLKPLRHRTKNISDIHPIRDPMPNRGILIQIDGTPFDWFGDDKMYSLHLAVDDATGEILSGWFMPTECLEGYVHMLEILLNKHGIPENFYSDRHTILINPIDDKLTQFGKICEDIGINIIAALTSQAKGKVEEKNEVVQNRLPNDLKRFKIKSYEQLNIWFNDFYINYLNNKFSYPPKEEESHFVPLDNTDLSNILCIRVERKMLNGNVVSYKNNYYKIDDNEITDKPIYKGTVLIVYENVLTKVIKIKYRNKFYNTILVPGHKIDPEKRKQIRVENQKILEQVLKERDERLKARANKMSS